MISIEKARAALAAHPLPENPWLEVTDEAILIKAGFSEQLLQLLRWVPKIEWRPDKRHWVVPLSGAETIRSVLPEITRLAELTQPGKGRSGITPDIQSDEELFRNAARLLFGAEWQREIASALGRNETELARWLLGEVLFGDTEALLQDMLALMRQRAARIEEEAERFAAALERRKTKGTVG